VLTAKAAATAPTGTFERLSTGLRRFVFGRPLATEQEIEERLPKWKALSTFSSDNLSSVAYATELIMFTLLAAGTAAFWLVLPISGLIVTIFVIIVISYRQTIRAYPSGGGSYIVARENLGTGPALLAAAALLTDYVLTVSVSVAAGVLAVTSAFPDLDAVRVPLGVVSILFVMLINLRGCIAVSSAQRGCTPSSLLRTNPTQALECNRSNLKRCRSSVSRVPPSWCRRP